MDALAVFNGPDAYVSAGFYPSKLRHGRVAPTWNYVAVHATGRLTAFREADQLVDHLTRLSDHLEQEQPQPWAVSDAPEGFTDRLVTAITGFRLEVSQLDGIRKLSQNSRPEDRAGVVAALDASTHPGDRALHAEMTRAD
ncbi:FMN-binding negative transcriptional regulator [Pseudooceanicola sp.]|uniref:FMN-binding negative transcriptional regulator n=1 Tax=Pseudooceanicola sp. TaxID=1914328 RepID=UPI0035C73C22